MLEKCDDDNCSVVDVQIPGVVVLEAETPEVMSGW